MRKTALYILIFTTLLALTGCVGLIQKSQLNSIKVGMTKEQVVQILGKPKNITSSGDSEVYRYFVNVVNSEYVNNVNIMGGDTMGGRIYNEGEKLDYYDLYFRDGKFTSYSPAGEETINEPPDYRPSTGFRPAPITDFRPSGRRF